MGNALVLTATVLGIVQAFKIAGLPSRLSPLVAMAVGVVVYTLMEGIAPQNIVTGLAIGLSAVGLYKSGTMAGNGEFFEGEDR